MAMTDAWSEAQKVLAGGVNSPVRAFKAVGGEPVFMQRANGPRLYDRRGRGYIDYCLSWGAIILGHADPAVVRAVQTQAARGTSFGTATEAETALGRAIQQRFPSMQRIRFTSSGTEAVMSAIRLARGVTGKNRVIKFEGCYHGHGDSLLVKAGSGLATFGKPDSKGVPVDLASLTTVLPYNDAETFKKNLRKLKDVACVIVEPVAGNMGVVPAELEFLETLKKETKKIGALLIFDEVITGFRVGAGGAQRAYGVEPDITILGKIIGGGLPIGALGAGAKIMSALSPQGSVYQAGTLSGNSLSTAAGLAVLSRLSGSFYDTLNYKMLWFAREARRIFKKRGRRIGVQSVGSMFTLFFTDRPVKNFNDARRQNFRDFKRFFHRMLAENVYLPPSAYEAWFLSAAHTDKELKRTLGVWQKC